MHPDHIDDLPPNVWHIGDGVYVWLPDNCEMVEDENGNAVVQVTGTVYE